MQSLDRCRRRLLDRVGHSNNCREPAANCSIKRRLAFTAKPGSDTGKACNIKPKLRHITISTYLNALTIDHGLDAKAGDGGKI